MDKMGRLNQFLIITYSQNVIIGIKWVQGTLDLFALSLKTNIVYNYSDENAHWK